MNHAFNVKSLVACLGASLLTLAAPLASTAAAERGSEGSVIVLATQGSVHGIGVGTVIAKAGIRVRVLTAAHVATHGTLQLRLADGAQSPARLLVVVPGRDLALIEADVTEANAANLRPAPFARPEAAEPVHVWGSGNDGPAYETATVKNVGRDLPDGAGIYNERGELVGVYIGYFEVGRERLSVAELPAGDVEIATLKPLRSAIDPSSSGPAQIAASDVAAR